MNILPQLERGLAAPGGSLASRCGKLCAMAKKNKVAAPCVDEVLVLVAAAMNLLEEMGLVERSI